MLLVFLSSSLKYGIIFLLSIFILLSKHGHIVTLAAWSLGLVPWFVKAWSLELLAIDPDPRSILRPVITHDLELSPDRQQLALRCILNFYCELFHVFILSFNCVCFMALEAWSLRLACRA